MSRLILRGLKKRCPKCGQGRLYQKWYQLRSHCPQCGLRFLKDPVDILVFMYLSTAFLTGLFILLMFWILPADQTGGRIILLVGALALMVLSLPYRKGVALALEYWSEQKFNASH